MDPMTAMALANMGSKVLGAQAQAEAGPLVSGLTNNGWMGLGNEGMTVNFGGSGLNLQGGAAGALPSWIWIAGAAAAVLVLWK